MHPRSIRQKSCDWGVSFLVRPSSMPHESHSQNAFERLWRFISSFFSFLVCENVKFMLRWFYNEVQDNEIRDKHKKVPIILIIQFDRLLQVVKTFSSSGVHSVFTRDSWFAEFHHNWMWGLGIECHLVPIRQSRRWWSHHTCRWRCGRNQQFAQANILYRIHGWKSESWMFSRYL